MGWPEKMTFMPNPERVNVSVWLPTSAPLDADYPEGRTDDAYTPYIYPAIDRRLSDDGDALMIGSAGVDGIEFALRKQRPGVWVFIPYSMDWRWLAEDIATFEADWLANRIEL